MCPHRASLARRRLFGSSLLAAFLAAGSAFAVGPAATPAPLRVVDARGRTVSFDALPKRIAVAGRAVSLIANTLYLFPEAPGRVVAIPDSTQQVSASFLSLLDPALAAKALPGGAGAGPEQIAPYHPDAVVLKSQVAEKLGEPLERLGLRVVCVDGESPEKFLADVAILGRLLGNEKRASEIAAFYEGKMRRVREKLRDLPPAGRPRVLFLTVSTRGGGRAFNVPPAAWLQTRLVAEAGGEPVVDPAFPGAQTVTAEQVAAWKPDRIVVAHYRGDSREVVAALRADPVWAAMPAVKAGRLDAFPGDFYSWDQPDPRWILGELWLAKTLHPSRFPDLDPTAELFAFFRTLYGLPEETVKAKILPVLTGDVAR
ncbi:MAG: ABC transporter substrate-binding protein [Thermoanaerobaculia bacterium]